MKVALKDCNEAFNRAWVEIVNRANEQPMGVEWDSVWDKAEWLFEQETGARVVSRHDHGTFFTTHLDFADEKCYTLFLLRWS